MTAHCVSIVKETVGCVSSMLQSVVMRFPVNLSRLSHRSHFKRILVIVLFPNSQSFLIVLHTNNLIILPDLQAMVFQHRLLHTYSSALLLVIHLVLSMPHHRRCLDCLVRLLQQRLSRLQHFQLEQQELRMFRQCSMNLHHYRKQWQVCLS